MAPDEPVNTFRRVRRWLPVALDIEEESIGPQSTLGDLRALRPAQPEASAHDDLAGDPILRGVDRDSLDVIELTMALEETFDLEPSERMAERLSRLLSNPDTTVQRIADFVDAHSRA